MKRTLFLGLVLVLLPGLPASAKSKHAKSRGLGPVRTATAAGNPTSGSGTLSIASATCPARLQAVGGGFSAPSSPGRQVFVIASYRSSVRTWTVEGLGGPGSGAVTAYAYCRRNNHKISDISQLASISGGGNGTGFAAANCPRHWQLIGGGFQATHGPDSLAFVLPAVNRASTSRTWTVVASNNGSTHQTLTAHAYCMRRIAAPAIRTASSPRGLGPGSLASVYSPPCPKAGGNPGKAKKKPSKLLSAGGFDVPPATSTNSTLISSSTAVTGRWLTGITVAMGTGPVPVTAQGICF